MVYIRLIALLAILYFSTISPGQSTSTDSNARDKLSALGSLLGQVLRDIPRKDTNKLFSSMFKNEDKIIPKAKKKHLKALAMKEEIPTKKSTEALPQSDNKAAMIVALAKPNVYLVNLRSKGLLEGAKTQENIAEKRFNIPQSEPQLKYDKTGHRKERTTPRQVPSLTKVTTSFDQKTASLEGDTESPEYRTKRQEGLGERLPILGTIPESGIQTIPVLNTIEPAQGNVPGDVAVRSDVSDINSNKVVAFVPVKVEQPLTVTSPSSVAMVSTNPEEGRPEIVGTSRSSLPVTTLIQTSPDISTKTPSILRNPDVGNLLVRLGEQQNQLISPEHEIKLTPEEGNENDVIKLAQVPLRLLNQETGNSDDGKTEDLKEKMNVDETKAVKLDQLSFKPLTVESKDDGERKTAKTDTSSEDINQETLKSLQTRLTKIITKLEEKANKKEGNLQQEKKESALSAIDKSKPSEKSLKFLKERLSNVLKKFNSKPGARQPFTIGKEWENVMSGETGTSYGKQAQKEAGSKSKKITPEKEGNWPSIASQLLRKLNKALIKLHEQKVAHSLGKEAVMYFSFDKRKDTKSTMIDESSVDDKSGHFNAASVTGRAETSSRTYGSCGKALILNSGNLRFMDKYFKTKPTKAITLAMWVRTNVTGYVKWFARDSGPSRDFNTHTQYPLVHKNVWSHLCGTFNSSTGITRIYVDGELKTEKVNRQRARIPADFTPAGIGPEFGDETLIAVDEVYMFARALDPREVKTLYDDCEFNRMVLHYGFQKINRTAGLVFDQSGLHNDAHLQGDARILDSGCDKCGSCLDLNAPGEPRLTVQATHFKHKPTKAVSIGAWFNLNSTSGTHPLFSVTESISQSPLLDLLVTDGKLQWKGYNKEQNAIFNLATAQAVVPEGVWVHILATFDSLHGLAKIFVDGHQKAVEETAKKVPVGEDWREIRIGGHESRAQSSGGYMDEFVLYNWELEPSEIAYIMKYCPDHPKLVSFTVHVPLD